MPQQHAQQVESTIRDLQARLRANDKRLRQLDGRRLLCIDRGAREQVPAPLDGQMIVEASDDTAWYYANGQWWPFCCEREAVEPDIVFLAFEGSPLFRFDLWKAGNLATPERFATTVISSLNANADFLADPELSPDGSEVIYSRAGHNLTPRKTSVRKVDWDDTTNVELYSETGGFALSMQPTWNPAGTKILFRAKGATSELNVLKSMDPDGSNVATLYTGAARLFDPAYNHDGTKIAWKESSTLKVANADGTGAATIYTSSNAGFPYWARTQDKLAFVELAAGPVMNWRIINADGTGVTTIHSIDRSGYGPGDNDTNGIKWTWVPDDSFLVTTIIDDPVAAEPQHVLTKIFTDGSGIAAFSPERKLYIGTPDGRPVAFGTRVYFPDANPNLTVLSSVKLDGSDYRTDLDGPSFTPDVVFHGFKGDTLNI